MTTSTDYRPELPAMTERIARLPVHRGYPVPWFVAWVDESGSPLPRGEGEPDFRVLAPDSLDRAYFDSLCWICGEFRGRYAAFVAGPMCAVNRTSAEAPSHPECAGWSACACPFLTRAAREAPRGRSAGRNGRPSRDRASPQSGSRARVGIAHLATLVPAWRWRALRHGDAGGGRLDGGDAMKRLRQFICSRCGRLGCLDRICHGGVDV